MVIVLIIEGGAASRNGNLRIGFHKLLIKELKEDSIPRIIMGESKKESIKKFINSNKESSLLIDLDKEESYRMSDLVENNLKDSDDFVFYMIQEMEAWFFSQPEILHDFYPDIPLNNFTHKDIMKINNPAELLQEITQFSKSRKYHKIKHAVELLPQLDTGKLKSDFPEFKRLIEILKN